jgi:mono/diheme cytochrome c family protein
MRERENYTPHISLALVMTLAIIITFQLYINREPARIEKDIEMEHQRAFRAGSFLYRDNCVTCHGPKGQGGIGPALNSRPFLTSVSDQTLFNLTSTGVPGTVMPAWNQAFGGPFTSEQINDIVAFLRSWEPTAPEPEVVDNLPDPARGAVIYMQTCFICHGENGQGTNIAPALRDLEKLAAFDDIWYQQTISFGRPAKGMPTWGTVLSPEQIDDVVALIAAWREGRDVIAEIPYTRYLTNALFAIRQFDREDAEFFLMAAEKIATESQRAGIQDVLTLVEENRLFEAEAQLISLLPSTEVGNALFEKNCSSCHGTDGTGIVGPNLHNNVFIQSVSEDELVNFILQGRPGTAMLGFDGVLLEDDVVNLVAFLLSWQEE